jgi:hypothetical protein
MDKFKSELSNVNTRAFSTMLKSLRLPRVAMKDHVRAILTYKLYVNQRLSNSNIPLVSKPCFLYMWLCARVTKSSGVHMRDYSFFGEGTDINMSRISYRDFTQSFVEDDAEVRYSKPPIISHEAQFVSIIHHKYPLSLRYLMDKIPIDCSTDYSLLSEGNIVYVKSCPSLMSHTSTTERLVKKAEQDNLVSRLGSISLRSDHCTTMLSSEDESEHTRLLKLLSAILPVSEIDNVTQRHVFSFPGREIHYSQIVDWITKRKIQHSKREDSKLITIDNFMDGARYEFSSTTLESHHCYNTDETEIYRLKGDEVLQVIVYSNKERQHLENIILRVYEELDRSITDTYADVLDLDASDIAKLRATNSQVFDGLYCRRAPPSVQPIVIKESQVEESLAKGKMILRYKGALYTTRDPEVSHLQNYIGMINKFGDYDPSKTYVPIIRTYKTNHLLSKNFKELKAYLLRHSSHPNLGFISKDDIILPPKMQHLYKRRLVNPDPKVTGIHSKKITIANKNKVDTGEVPDHVKSLLGTSHVKRTVQSVKGTGLLEACEMAEETVLVYMVYNRAKYLDMLSLTIDEIRSDVLSGMLDHRLYGKALEDMIGKSLIVFGMDGLIPYRYGKCKHNDYMLLFRSDSGVYDRIVVGRHHQLAYSLENIRSIVNSGTLSHCDRLEIGPNRPVDYTFVYLRLLGYLYTCSLRLGLKLSYELVPESQLQHIVEAIYLKPIYYEGYVRSGSSKLCEGYVSTRGSYVRTDVTKELLINTLRPMIKDVDELVVLSPIMLDDYTKWNFLLEDCLYYSAQCCNLNNKQEVLCVRKPKL